MTVIRAAIRAESPDQPVVDIQTIDEMLAAERWPQRIFGAVFAVLAAASLLLSGIGVYGVMAYAVSQRTHEIGIRMAVGANRRAISWLIIKRALAQLAIGLPIGLVGGVMLGSALQRLLIELSPADPLTLAAVVLLLTAAAMLACVVPARRAMRVDPVVALRTE